MYCVSLVIFEYRVSLLCIMFFMHDMLSKCSETLSHKQEKEKITNINEIPCGVISRNIQNVWRDTGNAE